MNEIRPFVLYETNYKKVKNTEYSLAVLPWGAIEAHNYHLPYGTDTILAEEISIKASTIAWQKGARPIVLPSISYGVNTGQMGVPLCINMNPSTQLAILTDIIQVLQKDNIDKLVIVNAHGGNNFKQIIRELSLKFPDIFVCAINWWQVKDGQNYFEEPGDHAGELETAAVMHLKPELVLPIQEAGSGKAKTFKIKGLKEGWVSAQREWTKVTEDTGVGDPVKATPQKGKTFFEDCSTEIAHFFYELHSTNTNDLYED